MKRILCKVILPGMFIWVVAIVCFPVCMKEEGFDFFQFWILTGFLFGFQKMSMVLIPKNYGIGGSLGVLALNCIVGGIIGGFVLCYMIIKIFAELTCILLETFGQKVLK